MKKKYAKPQIVFEDFTLSTNIASTACETPTALPTSSTCGINMSGLMVFLDIIAGCSDLKIESEGGDGGYKGLCYHVPSGSNNLFAS